MLAFAPARAGVIVRPAGSWMLNGRAAMAAAFKAAGAGAAAGGVAAGAVVVGWGAVA